jgi:hypothetical protein
MDPDDFTDPSARALMLRILEITHSEARTDWRPDLLELAADEWLEEPINHVRGTLRDIERLTDEQIANQVSSVGKQLRAARLSSELPELSVLAQESDPDALVQVKERIGQITSELAALRRQAAGAPRGPSALGTLPPLIPARFRAVDLASPPARPPSTTIAAEPEPDEDA